MKKNIVKIVTLVAQNSLVFFLSKIKNIGDDRYTPIPGYCEKTEKLSYILY